MKKLLLFVLFLSGCTDYGECLKYEKKFVMITMINNKYSSIPIYGWRDVCVEYEYPEGKK